MSTRKKSSRSRRRNAYFAKLGEPLSLYYRGKDGKVYRHDFKANRYVEVCLGSGAGKGKNDLLIIGPVKFKDGQIHD